MRFRSGFIGLVGPPNVGKSTLLNRILGTKVAIVSPKPQTTRTRVAGVFNGEHCQMIFMDTPGIHRTKTALHESMVQSALAAFHEVDILVVMIEIARGDDPEIRTVLRDLRGLRKPCLLVINKMDRAPRERLLPLMDAYQKKYPFDAIVPISALKGDGVDVLLEELKHRLAPGPQLFPPDMHTDQTEHHLIAEIIREQIYLHMRKELPYSAAVTVTGLSEFPDKGLISITACIHVETESQKGIFIGRKGGTIKAIGRSARLELESILGAKVYLNLRVKVEKNWSKDTRALRRLGY
ncbi:MAG: GTPase Era [Deltaproteobacteria bacterium]|nr:GTPase Era [Deltaproteobacteria bacterium]